MKKRDELLVSYDKHKDKLQALVAKNSKEEDKLSVVRFIYLIYLL